MTCASCEHFTDRALSDAMQAPEARKPAGAPKGGVGICRRNPPLLFPAENNVTFRSRFPDVHREHECGEYSSRVPL